MIYYTFHIIYIYRNIWASMSQTLLCVSCLKFNLNVDWCAKGLFKMDPSTNKRFTSGSLFPNSILNDICICKYCTYLYSKEVVSTSSLHIVINYKKYSSVLETWINEQLVNILKKCYQPARFHAMSINY